MKNDYPIFKNMEDYGFYDQLSEDELIYVLSGIFGKPVRYSYDIIYDENGNEIYFENSEGFWVKREYDENGNEIYFENSEGFWVKREYDDRGNRIYYENSDGFWEKRQFDENGKLIYSEDSNGYIKDNR